MKIDKELYTLVKNLDNLGINVKQRRKLIKTCYDCFGRLEYLEEYLNESINESKQRKKYGLEAYKFIKERVSKE